MTGTPNPTDPAAEVPHPRRGSRAPSPQGDGAGAGVPHISPPVRDAGHQSPARKHRAGTFLAGPAPAGGAASQQAPSAGSIPPGWDGVGVPPGHMAIAAAMKEDRGPDSLDARVRRLCEDLGLLRYHVFDARRSAPGFPDLVIAGPRGVLFRELKAQRGKVTAEQQRWLDALTAAGQNAATWRPASLLSGAIAAELTAISAWNVRRGTRCVCDQYGSCPKGCPWCPVCGGQAA